MTRPNTSASPRAELPLGPTEPAAVRVPFAAAAAGLDSIRSASGRVRGRPTERLVQQRELERVDILTAIGRVAAAPQGVPRPLPGPTPRLAREGLPLAATGEAD